MRWLLLVWVAGCTATNPNLENGDLGLSDGAVDGATSDSDGALPFDAAQAPASCSDGPRSCGNGGSQVCTDGTYTADRECPKDSVCGGGYCQPPADARSCTQAGLTSEALCQVMSGQGGGDNDACQPFVSATSVLWECASPIGSGTAGQSCNEGKDCRSGLCSNGRCFRVCTSTMDCPKQNQPMQCVPVTVEVEGVTIDTRTCIPQG